MATIVAPSSVIDLRNWKLTLPVDSRGSSAGSAFEVKNLQDYADSYFLVNSDGEVVFTASTDGATTSGSHYARSELREMNGSSLAAWTVQQGGTMVATLDVQQVPSKENGSPGRIVIGQIHGQDDELARLYYDNGTVYVVSDHAGPANKEVTFALVDAGGAKPQISLNETFSYLLKTEGHTLTVGVLADGQVYGASIPISSTWDTDRFYFKAGAYLGVGADGSGAGTEGSGIGEVAFHALKVEHGSHDLTLPTAGEPAPPMAPQPDPPSIPAEPDPVPVQPDPVPTRPDPVAAEPDPVPVPVPTQSIPLPPQPAPADPVPVVLVKSVSLSGTGRGDTLTGHAGDDVLKGQKGNDLLTGGAGDDELWGNSGNDTLVGGAGDDWLKGGDGRDTYVFGPGHGYDTIDEFRSNDALRFTDGMFSSVEQAKSALEATADGVLLHTGSHSAILFTHADLKGIVHADWFV